ncbi:MAG TPA: hypothetical protein VIY48_12930 [Candidatus Paceibacterota bacterium]
MTDSLTKLFGSPARVKLLRLFLFNPRQQWSLKEAAAHAQVTPAATRAELKVFVSTKIIKQSRQRYQLNENFEYLAALQALLLNAPARGRDIYERLRTTGAIKLIIVAGIFVGDWEGRIDLLVVGDRIKDQMIRRKLRALESELGKELRYAVLSTPEFSYRLNLSDKLVRDVMDYPHTVVFDRLNIGIK